MSQINIIGTYRSKEYGLIHQEYLSFFEKTVFVEGSTLKLNADSTYNLQTCGNIINGNWKVHMDTLFLLCKNNRYRNDSLNRVGYKGKFPDCGEKPEIFIIDKSLLKQIVQIKSIEKYKVLNYLEKIDDK